MDWSEIMEFRRRDSKLNQVAWSGDEDLDSSAEAIARYCPMPADMGELVDDLMEFFGPEMVLEALSKFVDEYIDETM